MKIKTILPILAISAVVGSSHAAVIASYNTFDSGLPSSFNDKAANPDAVASALSLGGGLINFTDGANRLGNTINNFGFSGGSAGTPTDLSSAITDADYLEFTITPDTGLELEMTSLSFSFFARASSATAAKSLSLLSSADGFTSAIDSHTTVDDTSDNVTLSLTGMANVTSATTFRLYMFGSTDTTNGASATSFDDFSLEADAVPEPSGTALLGLGGLALILRRRR